MEFKRKKKKPKKTPAGPSKFAIEKARLESQLPTDEERFVMNCHVARHMEKRFGRRSWMNDFIDSEGNNLPYHNHNSV